ncbi:MAG: DnaD domain protein [Lachnospiraceae bacterium]|nr:DnaD domain protein [Lachnospiraceae bacterium]
MNQFSITAKNQPTYTIVPDSFILEYMPRANGSYVKVYLYLCLALSKNRPLSISELAESCNETENDIKRALQYWEKEGLLSLHISPNRTLTGIVLLTPVKETPKEFALETPETITSEPELATAKEVPTPPKKEYSVVQIKEREKDTSFSQLVYMIETYFGRPFTQTDYHSLIYILDDLEFSLELLEYLVEYCVSKNKTSMRYIETVAIAWHKEGIKTIKAAKLQSSSYNELYTLVSKSLGLGRAITSVEADFIDNWQNKLGFEAPMIQEACNRAVLHSPTSGTITYVNGILETWNNAKVHNFSELAKFDEEYKKTQALKQNKANAGATKKALNYSQRTYNPDSLDSLFLEEVNRTPSQGRNES